jgi:glyoxylase-like metal-dependent hydrolase (beta-lactamase superfamily II)
MAKELQIDIVVSEPFAENSYIVNRPGDKKCFVIDPGFDPEEIIRRIHERQLELEVILLTHGHADHIAGCAAMKEEFPSAPLVIGAGDANMLTDPLANLSALGGMEVISPPADILLQPGQTVKAIDLMWEVREIPGHSPGHIVYIWHEGEPPVVFGGDVLFQGSVGRADFPGGDGPLLIKGIKTKLYDLPDDTVVFPGHGEPTTVGIEKETNPFTTGRVRIY